MLNTQEYGEKSCDRKRLSEIIRDSTHNLDFSNTDDAALVDKYTLDFIMEFEGKENRAYDDEYKDSPKYAAEIFRNEKEPRGKITVGYGFNMDRGVEKIESRREWEQVFHGTVSFDDVYFGRTQITDEQALSLLQFSVNIRKKEVANMYGSTWNKLPGNMRIAIISAYYNGPVLVKPGTRFFKNIELYANTGDDKYLNNAVIELRNYSGKTSRRKYEALLLDSRQAPFYRKPNESPLPAKPLKVVVGETRLPRNVDRLFPQLTNSEFIIWRTRLDDKVRKKHIEREGKVYHVSMLSSLDDYGCRCSKVPVTNNLLIVNKKDEIVSLHSWIKYGGGTSLGI